MAPNMCGVQDVRGTKAAHLVGNLASSDSVLQEVRREGTKAKLVHHSLESLFVALVGVLFVIVPEHNLDAAQRARDVEDAELEVAHEREVLVPMGD